MVTGCPAQLAQVSASGPGGATGRRSWPQDAHGPGAAARRCSTGRRPGLRASGPAAGGPGRSGRSGRRPAASTTGRPDGRCRRSCIPGTCRTRCRRRWASGSSDADVRRAAAGPHRDRGGLAAVPRTGGARVTAAAPLADPLPGGVAAGYRLDLAAVRAVGRDLPGGARLAHAAAGACGKAASRPGRSARTRAGSGSSTRGRSARRPAARPPAAPREPSMSGSAASAAASSRSTAGLVATASTAAAASPAGSDGRPPRSRAGSAHPGGSAAHGRRGPWLVSS